MSPVQSAPYTCDTCRQPIAVCDGISYGSIERGYRQLCSRCFNRVPLLMIDGREISWEQFGRMLMSFEGWQFKLEIRDRSEEI